MSVRLEAFSHEALLYESPRDLIERTVPFIREGLAAGEPVMVAMQAPKLEALREALGDDSRHVELVDMGELGGNPARIIPAWNEFLRGRVAGRPARGIGEPIWHGRGADELVECQLHESLLNVAFAGARGFRLLCPYDAVALDPAVLREARCSHPKLYDGAACVASAEYRGLAEVAAPFDVPLPPPTTPAEAMSFDGRSYRDVRAFVARAAAAAGLDDVRSDDLLLAVHEIATNSVRHGGGTGVLRAWRHEHAVFCEIRDRGRIRDPLVGRRVPHGMQLGGRGIWLANQLCDLVQIRSLASGTVVRLRMNVG